MHPSVDAPLAGQASQVRRLISSVLMCREEKVQKIISLGLHIVRNLLAIRDAVADGSASGAEEEFANLQVGHDRP